MFVRPGFCCGELHELLRPHRKLLVVRAPERRLHRALPKPRPRPPGENVLMRTPGIDRRLARDRLADLLAAERLRSCQSFSTMKTRAEFTSPRSAVEVARHAKHRAIDVAVLRPCSCATMLLELRRVRSRVLEARRLRALP